MKREDIPALLRTPVREIDNVIDDLKLEQAGCAIHYCVDAAEIVQFCFPLNPFLPSDIDLNEVASDQAALYELFYKRQDRPILLPHYVPELVRHFNFVHSNTEQNLETIGMIERLIEGAPLEEDFEQSIDNIERNFEVKLAVWMGIGSIGARRLEDILSNRLRKITEVQASFLQEFLGSYKPKIVDSIYRRQEASIRERLAGNTKKLDQRLTALRIDAAAIDWLLQLNNLSCQTKHHLPNGAQVPKHLFLYVSSAPKTRRIFDLPEVREMLPQLSVPTTDPGLPNSHSFRRATSSVRHFRIWRTRRQISVRVTGARNTTDPKDIIDNLHEIRSVANAVQKIEAVLPDHVDYCESCVMKGGKGKPDCESIVTCRYILGLQESINQGMEPVENLGLLARIQAYKQLLQGKPQRKDQKAYLDYLKAILKREDVPDAALRRIQSIQSLARLETVLAHQKMEGMLLPGVHEEPKPKLKATHLPASRPWVEEEYPVLAPPYDALEQAVFEYHRKTSVTRLGEKEALLDRAMAKFHELEKRITYPGSPDHELARCLIYFSFGGTEGERDAFRHSVRMAQQYPERSRDFLRAGCFAAQELGRYQDVHNAASRGIEVEPSDWLFYHARSVNTFEWWQDAKMRKFCPTPLSSCIEDIRTAAKLLPGTHHGFTRVTALIGNNLAYFSSFDSQPPFDAIFDLDTAWCGLKQLERVIPESEWTRPAYFHTKAHLLFRTWRAAPNLPDAVEHLRTALQCIDVAISLRDTPLYRELKRAIERGLRAD